MICHRCAADIERDAPCPPGCEEEHLCEKCDAETRVANQKPHDVDRLARAIWKHVELMNDQDAAELAFDESEWNTLLIEEERDQYRATAIDLLREWSA